ncbi:hypothetical protein [Microtetraspora sp. NBRC 16547]|uniref:hypothetical protein n=1 Tax=Microtetraspora sp. NBRC 16547 TaxID=3030993 RepID=UPI0024A41BFC|nr:hypothetical protein [Microtetraspora sp. NBRC 16547]GLX00991.1 hypothetical protein Misp02_50770 [Microtetraspora sp. NBRC 16547]
MYGWIILSDAATKRVNGQEVIVTAGKSGDIGVVIKAWENAERHRMLYELGNLGRLVDEAMTHLQLRHRTPDSRERDSPESDDIQ